MASSTLPRIAIPGQRLGPATSFGAGPGTHIQDGSVCASIAGALFFAGSSSSSSSSSTKGRLILSVSRTPRYEAGREGLNGAAVPEKVKSTAQGRGLHSLPAVESTVLVRVTRVQKRQVTVSILVVLDEEFSSAAAAATATAATGGSDAVNQDVASILASAPNPENHSSSDELCFQALIRKEDVRAVEKDQVIMEDMFRVGDIVRATVVSLGDQSFYYLTTARNDLGVVMARSEAGNMMFPVSWKEMRDPLTGRNELRKVARPF